AEGAELAQAVEDVLGILAGLVDRGAVDLLVHEGREPAIEGGELRPLLLLERKGVDQRQQEVAEEDLAQESPAGPDRLARLLRDLTGLLLACGLEATCGLGVTCSLGATR